MGRQIMFSFTGLQRALEVRSAQEPHAQSGDVPCCPAAGGLLAGARLQGGTGRLAATPQPSQVGQDTANQQVLELFSSSLRL